MDDWYIFFTNKYRKGPDLISFSSRYTKDQAIKEFHSVFPGVKMREIKRMDGFKAEDELVSRVNAANRAKKPPYVCMVCEKTIKKGDGIYFKGCKDRNCPDLQGWYHKRCYSGLKLR